MLIVPHPKTGIKNHSSKTNGLTHNSNQPQHRSVSQFKRPDSLLSHYASHMNSIIGGQAIIGTKSIRRQSLSTEANAVGMSKLHQKRLYSQQRDSQAISQSNANTCQENWLDQRIVDERSGIIRQSNPTSNDQQRLNYQQQQSASLEELDTPGWTSMAGSAVSSERNNNAIIRDYSWSKGRPLMENNQSNISNYNTHSLRARIAQKLGKSIPYSTAVTTNHNGPKHAKTPLRQFINQQNQPNTISHHNHHQQSFISESSSGHHQSIASLKSSVTNQHEKNITNVNNIPNRPTHLSVHETLYLKGKKQLTKRLLEAAIHQHQQKRLVCTFRPHVNEKSLLLAQEKVARILTGSQSHKPNQTKEELNIIHTEATGDFNQPRDSISCRQSQTTNKSIQSYQILNRLFFLLSQDSPTITQNTISTILPHLPQPCISTLQPALISLFQGKQLTFGDFVEKFNAGQCKEAFFGVLNKWLTKRELSEGSSAFVNHETKSNYGQFRR